MNFINYVQLAIQKVKASKAQVKRKTGPFPKKKMSIDAQIMDAFLKELKKTHLYREHLGGKCCKLCKILELCTDKDCEAVEYREH